MKKSDKINLALMHTQHSRIGCSDANPRNGYTTKGRGGYARCNRCALILAKQGKLEIESLNISFQVELKLESKDG